MALVSGVALGSNPIPEKAPCWAIGDVMRNVLLGLGLALGVIVMMPPAARADTILFDRGLPTTNLNNAAGALRSNVAWGEGATGEVTPPSVSVGEDFTLTTMSLINSITVWVIDKTRS